ncbi:MAG TPA: hypothetical protein VFH31_20950, partial [Pyrinomonadaceae bacterium]|nr:hypothetical protein [Pyrinomonadaceae bacterium]
MKRTWVWFFCLLIGGLTIGIDELTINVSRAQGSGPTMLVPNLAVRSFASGFVTPISLAFIGQNDL